LRIVIELDAGANFEIRIRGAQFIDLIKINSGMKPIVISEGNVTQTARTRAIDPRLQQFSRVPLNAMSLRVGVVIAKELIADR